MITEIQPADKGETVKWGRNYCFRQEIHCQYM